MAKYPVRILLSLDKELAIKLQDKAELETRSQSSIIRQILKENL